MDPLQKLQKYLGKVLEITYREAGDDDEGYGWSNVYEMKMVLDGIVRRKKMTLDSIEREEYFLVGHYQGKEYIMPPDISVTDTSSTWPDRGSIEEIRCEDRPIDVHLLYTGYDPGRYGTMIKDSRRYRKCEGNYFLSPEYLKENGLEVVVSIK